MKCPHCNGTGHIPDDEVHVGALIFLHRRAKDMTQNELAQRVGFSRAQVANVENGRSDMPTKTLARFAAALGVSMKDLVP
jgi:transcriptional regulator with XRE-family HTH domain